MSSMTKLLLFQLKNLLIGSLHLLTHGRIMGNYESALTQRILIQLLDVITTKPLLWRDHPWTSWKHLLHQTRCNLILLVHSPWIRVITAHNLQHTMGKVLICLPPLWPSLCTGYLPTYDGPDPCPLQWSDLHCRWCSCSWKGWWGTWQMSPQIHKSHPWTWACLQQG